MLVSKRSVKMFSYMLCSFSNTCVTEGQLCSRTLACQLTGNKSVCVCVWGAGLCWYVKAKWIYIQVYLAHISSTEPQRVYSVVQMIVKWTIFWCVHEYSFMVWLMKYLNVVRIKVQFLKRLSPLSCFHRDCRDRWKQHKLSGFATWLVALQVFVITSNTAFS